MLPFRKLQFHVKALEQFGLCLVNAMLDLNFLFSYAIKGSQIQCSSHIAIYSKC